MSKRLKKGATKRPHRRITLPNSVKKTVDRRTWMSWVGKATVLSLGSSLLAQCTKESLYNFGKPSDSAHDGGFWREQADAGTDIAPPIPNECPAPTGKEMAFTPDDGTSKLYDKWPVWTVDPQDLATILGNWQLRVDGMVASPRTFSFSELLELPRQNQISDFHCVEGWSVYDVPWNGVQLSDIVRTVVPKDNATHITFHTIDGSYNESLPIEVALEPMTLIAYGICESTLPVDHGFPLRLVVPRMLAYKSAKYIARIEVTDTPIEGYWVARGYPYDAPVPSSRLREGRY